MVAITLVAGAIASLVMTTLVLLSWRFTPQVWLADITEGRLKPPLKIAIPVTLAIAAVILGGAIAPAWYLAAVDEANFFQRFLVAWGVTLFINVVDLVIIDWLIYVKIYPTWMRLEGIEKLEGMRPHIDGFFSGLWIGAGFAAIAALVTMLV